MVLVRSARPEDLEKIVQFQLLMAMETENLALDRETVTQGVQAVFDDPSKGEYWMAEQDGRVSGGLLTVPEWSDWRNGTVLWIHSLYVIPEARKQGVFRALYTHLRERVEAAPNLKGLRLYVDHQNQAAQAVYQRMGMTDEHYTLYEWLK